MILPTAHLCVYTKYDRDGKLQGYAPWHQTGRNTEDTIAACFKHYGSDIAEGEWDCVDVHVYGFFQYLAAMLLPVTILTQKKIRRIRREPWLERMKSQRTVESFHHSARMPQTHFDAPEEPKAKRSKKHNRVIASNRDSGDDGGHQKV